MATGRIKGITIEIGGDTTKLVKALSAVDSAISKTQTNLRDINKALKFDPSNTELLKDKQVELANAIASTEEKLRTEKEALEQMKNSEGFDANSEAARNLKTQIDLDTVALKQLEQQARQSASVLGTQMQLAGQKIQEVGNKISAVGDRISGFGRTLTASVTTPIVTAFGGAVKAAVDWETAFTGVQKTVDASAEDYERLAENIKKMATETSSSKEEIAGVMEIAGQLGVTGVDNLTEFTKTMVELGDTTNLSAEDAATSLARFMNITGESTSNVDRIGSAIVDLGNNFATSESEITEMATRLASAGTIAGLTSTDILALAASMSSVGIEAEAGGTAMSQTLKTMANAVANFRDGNVEDLEVIANVSQMSADEFAKAWETNPINAIQAFVSGLNDVKDSGDNVFAVLSEMGMEGIRQTNMLQSLALASEMLGDAVHTSSEAYKENTALSDEAAKRYATMAAKMSQLKERIKEVAIEIGESLMPYIEKMMVGIENLVNKWKNLDDSQKEAVIKFAAIAAAIGPVLIVIGTLTSSIGHIVTAIGSAVSSIGGLMNGVGGLSGALSALASPVGIVVAAIAALSAGFAYLFTTNEEFRASIMQIVDVIRNNLVSAFSAIEPKLQSVSNAFNQLMETLTPIFSSLFEIVLAVINGIVVALEPLSNVVLGVINTIIGIVTAFFALMQGDFDGFWNGIVTALQGFINVVLGLIETNIALVVGFFEAFGINLKAIVLEIWNKIKATTSEVIEKISEVIHTKWTDIKEWLSETLGHIWDKFKEIFDNIKKSVSDKIGEVKDTIVDGMENAIEYISSLPGRFYNWGSEMIGNLISGIKSAIGGVGSAIGSVADTIASYIHFTEPDVGPLSNFHTFMPDMIDEMIKGINSNLPRLENAMNNMSGSMANSIQGSNSSVMATNNVSINVYGAQGQNVQELASEIEQIITNNVVRRGVAFG